MTNSDIPTLEEARRQLVAELAPDARRRSIEWSGGATQIIERGSGAPVLFVHGGLGQACHWLPLWPELPEDLRLIAVDRPGHGLSDPFDYRGVDVLDHAVEFLSDVLDELGLERAPIVANSMGARWAIELALRQPQRVERLILVGAPAGSIRRVPMQLPMMRWPIVNRIVRRVFRRSTPEGVRRFLSKILVADASRVPESMLVASAAGQRRNVDSVMTFVDRIVTRRAIRPELVIGDRWSRLEAPVTFIWGDADAFDHPETGRRAAQLCRDAELIELPGLGHLPWLDDAAAVGRAVTAALAGAARPAAAPMAG